MKIQWSVPDSRGTYAYINANCLDIDDKDIIACKTRSNVLRFVEAKVREKDKKMVTWYIRDRSQVCEEIEDILENT